MTGLAEEDSATAEEAVSPFHDAAAEPPPEEQDAQAVDWACGADRMTCTASTEIGTAGWPECTWAGSLMTPSARVGPSTANPPPTRCPSQSLRE